MAAALLLVIGLLPLAGCGSRWAPSGGASPPTKLVLPDNAGAASPASTEEAPAQSEHIRTIRPTAHTRKRALARAAVAHVVPGDLDGDGKVTERDVALAMEIAVGKRKPTHAQLVAGDVNGQGRITVADVTRIRRAVATHTPLR